MRGCLLVHGLTTTPAILNPLRSELMKKGYAVSIPLLSGHGGKISDLSESKWQDWYGTVKTAFAELRRSVDKVYYVGISLGGLLGLKLAADEGWGVRAMVLMSVPLRLPFVSRFKLAFVRHTPLRYFVKYAPKDLSRSIENPEARVLYQDMCLPEMPIKSVYQISDLVRNLRPQLKKITNPMMLMYGLKDPISPIYNIDLIKRAVSSDIVETVILKRSKHILTLDWDHEEAFLRVINFFNRFA